MDCLRQVGRLRYIDCNEIMNYSIELYALAARLVLVATMYVLMRTFSRWAYFHALLWLPATVAHEAAHFLLGVVFGAQPVGFSIWPRRVPGTNRYILGHVSFADLSWWKKLPVAIAPLLLLLPLGCWLIFVSLASVRPQWVNLLFCYAALQCFVGCWPSKEDWVQARCAIYVVLGLIAMMVVGYIALLAHI